MLDPFGDREMQILDNLKTACARSNMGYVGHMLFPPPFQGGRDYGEHGKEAIKPIG